MFTGFFRVCIFALLLFKKIFPRFRRDFRGFQIVEKAAWRMRLNPLLKSRTYDEIKAGLKDGSFVIWKGPIVGQDGKEVLAKDAVADDKFLGGIKFYVKGVEGKVPN